MTNVEKERDTKEARHNVKYNEMKEHREKGEKKLNQQAI